MKKSEQILQDGAAVRETFTPQPGSAPVKAYQYWVESSRSGIYPDRENFCHYWRVVLLWAPVWWVLNHTILSRPVQKMFDKVHFNVSRKTSERILTGLFSLWILVVLTLLVMAAIEEPLVLLYVVAGLLLFAAMLTAIVFIVGRFEEKGQERRDAERRMLHKALIAYYNDEGPYPFDIVVKEPGKFKKFLRAVGEYCLVAVNAVRVQKWKVCPLVDVPVDNDVSTVVD